MSNVEGMTKVETFVGFLTRPLPLGLASGLPVYVAVPASSILRIPKAFGTGTDALQFVHSDWFRYSSFVLRHSFHAPSLRIQNQRCPNFARHDKRKTIRVIREWS
jgi:hypothetical protein